MQLNSLKPFFVLRRVDGVARCKRCPRHGSTPLQSPRSPSSHYFHTLPLLWLLCFFMELDAHWHDPFIHEALMIQSPHSWPHFNAFNHKTASYIFWGSLHYIACSSHPQIVIWIYFWMCQPKYLQIVKRLWYFADSRWHFNFNHMQVLTLSRTLALLKSQK